MFTAYRSSATQFLATFTFAASRFSSDSFMDQRGYALDAPEFLPAGFMEPVSQWTQVPIAPYIVRD